MAFLATHVKFALDISRGLNLRDLGEYCAGAAYPDSRYVTGIHRRRTHFEDSPQDPFADGLTDFRRGWAAHNLYDVKAGRFYLELLPWPEEDLKQFNHVWCYLSAMKVIEDIAVYARFGSELPFLRELRCEVGPMGEDADKLERYFGGLRHLFADSPSLEGYGQLLRGWGADEETTNCVLEAAAKIDADVGAKNRVLAIYTKVLKDIGVN